MSGSNTIALAVGDTAHGAFDDGLSSFCLLKYVDNHPAGMTPLTCPPFAEPSSATFILKPAVVWIGESAEVVGIPGAEGIVDRVRRERRAVAAVGVTRRIGQ